MCDAGLVIGGLLSAGSMAANSAAQSEVKESRQRALQLERERQAGLQSQADALNLKSRRSFDNFSEGQSARKDSLASLFTGGDGQASAAQGAGQPSETAPGSTSSIVQQEQAKQSGKAKAYTDQQGNALAEMRSFGDYLGTLNRGQARDAGYIGQVGNFQQGSSAVMPYELEAANHAGDGLKFLGDVTRLGGSVSIGNSLLGSTVTPTAADVAKNAPTLARTFSSIPSLFDPGMTQLPKVY